MIDRLLSLSVPHNGPQTLVKALKFIHNAADYRTHASLPLPQSMASFLHHVRLQYTSRPQMKAEFEVLHERKAEAMRAVAQAQRQMHAQTSVPPRHKCAFILKSISAKGASVRVKF